MDGWMGEATHKCHEVVEASASTDTAGRRSLGKGRQAIESCLLTNICRGRSEEKRPREREEQRWMEFKGTSAPHSRLKQAWAWRHLRTRATLGPRQTDCSTQWWAEGF